MEEVWIPTTCAECYAYCPVRVRRVNGVVDWIERIPEPKVCGKSIAAIQMLYDPYRVNYPLKRTNPEKGIGIDPKWERITWKEAMDEIIPRLEDVKRKDPRMLFILLTTKRWTTVRNTVLAFMIAYGTPNMQVGGGGLHCGNGSHEFGGFLHGAWDVVPDYKYAKYILVWGDMKGFGASHSALSCTISCAEARDRGVKIVNIDPVMNIAGAKADEWIPIRPGTDLAVALSIINVLLNELNVYDAEYLKRYTNAPYLIGPDGLYVTINGKPVIWDPIDNKAKTWDDETIKDFALFGTYKVNGILCRPAFELLKEHVKQYTPEWASRISDVPANTIRKIAKELAENAHIGSYVTIDGKKFPYRPVAITYFRGAQGHSNSHHTCFAIGLISQILGCADNVGGTLGFCPVCLGHPETGRPYYVPKPYEKDGLLIPGTWNVPWPPYPVKDPTAPITIASLKEVFPTSMINPFWWSSDNEEIWTKLGLPYRGKVLLSWGNNAIMTIANPETVAKALKKFEFIILSELYLSEFSEFADIVLPDCSWLESLDPTPPDPFIFNHPATLDDPWTWSIRQPVVDPIPERKEFVRWLIEEVCVELGIESEYYEAYNAIWGLKEPFRLDPGKRYKWEEICDIHLKHLFGPERGLDWFKKHGYLQWSKKPEEVYWRTWVRPPVRVPIYCEFIKRFELKLREIEKKTGFRVNYDVYNPLPIWHPCNGYKERTAEYDLQVIYYRLPNITNSSSVYYPWVAEVFERDPWAYYVQINSETAKKKGLKDGDLVCIENPHGRKIVGRVRVVEGIHPGTIALAACLGHYSKYIPAAKGKGLHINTLLEIDLEHSDPINVNIDTCASVKIYKI